jgi:ABC-2 type transport system permease protein
MGVELETTTTPSAAEVRPGLLQRLQAWLLANPVAYKELRGRMRGRRAYILITVYTAVLSLAMLLVYFVTNSSSTPNNYNSIQLVGKALFGAVFWLQLLVMCFVAPALAAGAIASERERQTYELLRTTLLSARALVLGKFASGMLFLLLLLLVGLPLQSMAYLFGGVTLEELLVGTLLLIVTAAAFLAVGIFFSSLSGRTLISTVLSYGVSLLLVFGLPMLLFLLLLLQQNLISGTGLSNMNVFQETMLLLLLWSGMSLNPLATAVGSEVILLQENSLWSVSVSLSSSGSLSLPSPWIPYTILYTLLSLFLLWLAVRKVSRMDR